MASDAAHAVVVVVASRPTGRRRPTHIRRPRRQRVVRSESVASARPSSSPPTRPVVAADPSTASASTRGRSQWTTVCVEGGGATATAGEERTAPSGHTRRAGATPTTGRDEGRSHARAPSPAAASHPRPGSRRTTPRGPVRETRCTMREAAVPAAGARRRARPRGAPRAAAAAALLDDRRPTTEPATSRSRTRPS